MPITVLVALVCVMSVLLALPVLRSKGLIMARGGRKASHSSKAGPASRLPSQMDMPHGDAFAVGQDHLSHPSLPSQPSSAPLGVATPAPLVAAAAPVAVVAASPWRGPEWDRQDAVMALAEHASQAVQRYLEHSHSASPEQAAQVAWQMQGALDAVQLVSAGKTPLRTSQPSSVAALVYQATQTCGAVGRVHLDEASLTPWQVSASVADTLVMVVANLLEPLLSAAQAYALVQMTVTHDGMQLVISDQPLGAGSPNQPTIVPRENSFGLTEHQIDVATRCLLQPVGRQASRQELNLCVAGEAARAVGLSVRLAPAEPSGVAATVALPSSLLVATRQPISYQQQASVAAEPAASIPMQPLPMQPTPSTTSAPPLAELPGQANFAFAQAAQEFHAQSQPALQEQVPELAAQTPPALRYSAGVSVLPGSPIPTQRREMTSAQLSNAVQAQTAPPEPAPPQTQAMPHSLYPQPELVSVAAAVPAAQASAVAMAPPPAPSSSATQVGAPQLPQHEMSVMGQIPPASAASLAPPAAPVLPPAPQPAFVMATPEATAQAAPIEAAAEVPMETLAYRDAFATFPEQPQTAQVQVGATPPFALSPDEQTDQQFHELTQTLRHSNPDPHTQS